MTNEGLLAKFARECVEKYRPLPNAFGSPAHMGETYARTTCSTFLALALRAVFEGAPEGFPRARNFFADIVISPERHVEAIGHLRPGVVGAIGYDEDRDGMSGHCFVVDDVARYAGKRGTLDEWFVSVVDSCRSSHGQDDTRWSRGEGRGTGGIGRGVMRVFTNGQDALVCGYAWSTGAASEILMNGKGQCLAFGEIPRHWKPKGKTHG